MPSRVLGLVVGILLAGAIGFWIGKTQEGPALAGPACAVTGTLVFDGSAIRIIGNTFESKSLLAFFPDLDGNAPDVCWDFQDLAGNTKFDKLRIDTRPPVGTDGRTPLLVGDANFQGGSQRRVSLRYSKAAPVWSKVDLNGHPVDGVKWSFSVRAELQNGQAVSVDPDIIIIKDKPRR